MIKIFVFGVLLLGFQAQAKSIVWQGWSDQVFSQAKKENRLVILDLQAIWCHWCHVMDEKTYADPEVIEEISTHFIPVQVDQDSRPDLSNRYENYGWPATVIFDSQGRELAKRAGYISAPEMLAMLKAFVADPTPGPSAQLNESVKYASSSSIDSKLRGEVVKQIKVGYDARLGGWATSHKYLDPGLMEYFLDLSQDGDKDATKKAEKTLNAQKALLDPAWGGMYQYSAEGDWKHPHFEKIISVQADNLRIYAMAFGQFGNAEYLRVAKSIERYTSDFLTSGDGTFYTSQDADLIAGQHAEKYFSQKDKERRAVGIPKVDKHVYSRENGWMISSLTTLYGVTGDDAYLKKAIKAAQWILAHRSLGDGGFSSRGV